MASDNSNEKKVVVTRNIHGTSNEVLVPIDIVVDRAVGDLRDIQSRITDLFQDRPVDLEMAADYLVSARAIHDRTINQIRRHHQQTEEGLLVRQVRSSEKIRDRYTQFLPFDMHLRMYNVFTGHVFRKALLRQTRDWRLLKVEDALNKVTSHHKLVLADSGKVFDL